MVSEESIELLPWTEKYRPKNLDNVIGQEGTIKSLVAFVKTKNMPNLLFAGPPGVGKTTAALALARDLYGNEIAGNFLELNASDDRGIDIVRGKIKDFARSVSMGGAPFKLIFLDEGDALTPDAQHALRRTMEASSTVTRFIISANYSSRIIEPLQSRCAIFRFLPLNEGNVKKMLEQVANAENLKVDDEAYKAAYYVSEGDMRRAVNVLQGAAMHAKHITADLIHNISSRAKPKEVKEMLDTALSGDFAKTREKLDTLIITYGLSGEDILLQVYKEIPNLNIDEQRKIGLIDKIAEYNFRLVEGANERIQIEAMLAQFALVGKK
ncbi:MAG: replication factor C small subunit [Candidatus Micrarchaeota archaeon]|nr:replication factor C small subunit [Candidatus Micrarchaeota archaeon]